uniref:Beta-lactamase-related domain-containing protein n=1 Tax=uncultured Nocardioidaceae bacterium TaxID=253824 RepID=A0A6J4M5S3_9ACTN|nr:MAG: hypothetical protein AVDCRST_MAG46-2569 [uncultured Nocardioidaceae bacterium]
MLLVAGCPSSSPAPEESDQTVGSEHVDSEVGSDASLAAEVDDLVAADGEKYGNVRAVLVVQRGKTLVDNYYESQPTDRRTVFSVTKSVVATLVGIAEHEGLLQLDQTLAQLLPAQRGAMTPDVAAVTLEELLTMTAGFDNSPVFASAPNSVEYILGQGIDTQLRGSFAYSDASAHLVAAILTKATGQTLLDYARRHLFDPLDIDTRPAETPIADSPPHYRSNAFAWPTDAQGVHHGWSLLRMTAGDLVKLGQVYLDHGRWDGKQVVPRTWVEKATTPQVRVERHVGYGYLWYTPRGPHSIGYAALGHAGQVIAILPDERTVIVAISDMATEQHPFPVDSGELALDLARIVAY